MDRMYIHIPIVHVCVCNTCMHIHMDTPGSVRIYTNGIGATQRPVPATAPFNLIAELLLLLLLLPVDLINIAKYVMS